MDACYVYYMSDELVSLVMYLRILVVKSVAELKNYCVFPHLGSPNRTPAQYPGIVK